MTVFSLRTVRHLSLAAAGVSLLLIAVRSFSAISFSEPLQLTTSGAEYEFLYSIWKYINGLDLYADQTRIPFAATFYNWLFYAFYGELAGFFLKALALPDLWLPTVTRLITLAGGVCGAILTYRFFTTVLKFKSPDLKILSGAFAVYLFFGPLVGFFAIATRPDTWALVFDIAAIFFFITYYNRKPLLAVLGFCVLAYASWGFKQIFVYGPGTIGLFLLFRKDWKNLLVLTAVTWGAWGVTLLIGGPVFFKLLTYGDSVIVFSVQTMFRSLGNFAIKSLPVLAGLVVILAFPSLRSAASNAVRNSFPAQIAFLGLIVTALISIPASLKTGAAEHYFFSLSFYIAFLALSVLKEVTKEEETSRFYFGGLILGWLGGGLAVIAVLLGLKGVLSVRYIHENYLAIKPCLKNLPRPVYIASANFSLPWILPAKNNFVYHYHYFTDRAAGIKMEGGGIGGLIDRGYFATLVMGDQNEKKFDGSDLALYRERPGLCGGARIYSRIKEMGFKYDAP